MLESLANQPQTIVFYESPHKIKKTIDDLLHYFSENRKVAVCREISKKFEEIIRGTLQEVKTKLSERTLKGEIVVVLNGEKEESAKEQE